MRKIFAFFLLAFLLSAHNSHADDIGCVRNNCMGTCITVKEALGKAVPMLCNAKYICYQDAECIKLEDEKCGWKETETLKSCLAAATTPSPAPSIKK